MPLKLNNSPEVVERELVKLAEEDPAYRPALEAWRAEPTQTPEAADSQPAPAESAAPVHAPAKP